MKNKLKFNKTTVEKTFVSAISLKKEKQVLLAMYDSGIIPQFIKAENETITMQKINGTLLSDKVLTEYPLPLLCNLALWIKEFTEIFFEKTRKHIVLDDINPRNFIISDKVYGIDFENWHYGDVTDNYAGLLAMTDSLKFSDGIEKNNICTQLADYILDITGCDKAQLHKKAELKTATLSERRKAMAKVRKTTFVLLAGGNSSRMGRDKGLLPMGSHTFTDHIIYNMSMFDNMLISANSSEYEKFNIKVIKDNFTQIGPIGALQSALSAAETDWIFTLPCDMPFITQDIIVDLFSQADFSKDCIIAQADGKLFPTVALYSKKALATIEQQIENQDYKLMRTVDNLNSQIVTTTTPHQFANINTPQDYGEMVLDV